MHSDQPLSQVDINTAAGDNKKSNIYKAYTTNTNNAAGKSQFLSSSMGSNMDIPTLRRQASNIVINPLISRRKSVRRSSIDQRSISLSISNTNKIDMHSPNFKTLDKRDEREIINSVREHYLNDESSLQSNVSDQNRPCSSTIDDPNLQRVAGDMTRDIYKLSSDRQHVDDILRYQTMEDVELTMEGNRRKSTASGLKVPGGFRREFIINKMRKHESERDPMRYHIQESYGSTSKMHSGAISEDDPLLDDENSDNLEDMPFITRNFLEFLYIYGHFAGESFADDFYTDEDNYLRFNRHQFNPSNALASVPSKITMKEQMESVRGTASTKKVYLLLLKSFIGTGVLFLPRAFANGGLAFSIIMLIFFGIYSYWCYYILIESKTKAKVSSFGDIGLKLYGPWLKFLILTALGLTQVGFAGAYMIFTAKNLGAFIQNIFEIPQLNLGILMIFQLLIFIPLSFIRNVSKLSLPSLFANFFILIGLVIILFFFLKSFIFDLSMEPMENVIYSINDERWPLFIGTAIFAFEGIGLIIPVQESMRYPEKFPSILRSVILSVTILFTVMGGIGYLVYGNAVETVILLNLPQDNFLVNLIQLFYSIAIMLSTPLQLFPAIKIIEDKAFPKFTKIYSKQSSDTTGVVPMLPQYKINSGKLDWRVKWLKNLVRSVIVSLVVLYAYYGINYLDKVVAIVGSFCCLPLVYVIPPMLHLRSLDIKDNNDYDSNYDQRNNPSRGRSRFELMRLFDQFLIIFGTLSMLYTSYQSIVVS